MNKGVIFDIQKFSTIDGPGIRTTVFFKGCNLRCAWCHNPESQSKDKQLIFYQNKCTGCGKCLEKCPNYLKSCELCGSCTLYCPTHAREIVGKVWTVDEVFSEINADKIFYDTSGGGVTFSGGECMLQTDFLLELLKKCRVNGIHTAIDTAGHVPFEYFEKVIPYTNLFLYDVKCFDREKHKKYVGVYNDLILSNLKRLLSANVDVCVRIPVIPSVNDSEAELASIKDFIYSNGKPFGIELLPYHAMGEIKYDALSMPKTHFDVPSEKAMEELRKIFE